MKRPREFEYFDRSAQGAIEVIKRIPCTFPAEQGFRHRDEFAIDSTHRHSVCGCRDSPRAPATPEKSPRFRGVLAVESSRIRTGDCGLLAGTAPRPAFVSVARLGGSLWLPILPGCETRSNHAAPTPTSDSRSSRARHSLCARSLIVLPLLDVRRSVSRQRTWAMIPVASSNNV